jgi:small subunit ribosomal protein S6
MAEPTQAASTAVAGPVHAAGVKLREYETIFLMRPEMADDAVDKVVERMRGVVHRDGGKVLKITNMGKKKTAFLVKKNPRAIFIQVSFLGDSKSVAELERNLRMTDDVLKYQSVKLAEDVEAASRAIEADVKLPGDPETPERAPREEFGGGDRGGFGGDRGGGFGDDRSGGFESPEAEAE